MVHRHHLRIQLFGGKIIKRLPGSIISPLVTPGLTNQTGREAVAVFHINPPADAHAKDALDSGAHARAEGIGRVGVELFRGVGRVTLITQGYPHVAMVRIGPGAYGNTGVPYLDMVPQGGSGRIGADGHGARNGAPVIPGGRLITYHDIVSAIVDAGICPDNTFLSEAMADVFSKFMEWHLPLFPPRIQEA